MNSTVRVPAKHAIFEPFTYENDHLLGHKRFYTTESLRKDIEQVGFGVDRMEGIYLKPFTTNQMLSLDLDRSIIESLCTLGVDYPELSCGLLAEISIL